MESIILAIYLFLVTFVFFSWLTTPTKCNQIEANAEKTSVTEKVNTVEKSNIVERLNDFQNIKSLQSQLESKSENEQPNIKERSKHSLSDLGNQQLEIDITKLKIYKLHGNSCIKIKDLPEQIQIPQSIKLYKLRGEIVVKLSEIEPYLI